MSNVGAVIANVVVNLPQVLAIGLGLVLSVVFRQRLGNRSLFTLLGFIAMLLAAILSLIAAATAAYIPDLAEHQHMGIAQVTAYYGFVGLVRTVAELAGWVLLLIGIFRKPGTEPARSPFVPVPPGFAGQPGFTAPQPPRQQQAPAEPPEGPSPY
jgi:predicted cobalt transporter CbtA